jgi:hypothetical protein
MSRYNERVKTSLCEVLYIHKEQLLLEGCKDKSNLYLSQSASILIIDAP